MKLEGTTRDCLVQCCAQTRAKYKLPRPVASQVFSISKDGDSEAFLGNLIKCLTILTLK